MQYLLKIAIENTPVWRLIAVDGKADIAHLAQLISLAFNYDKSEQYFEIKGKKYQAGNAGNATNVDELKVFDDFDLQFEDEFFYTNLANAELTHRVKVLKVEEHLFCLMPSCLVGAGNLPDTKNLNETKVNEYYDSDDSLSLDLRNVTNRLREFGSLRKNVNEAMIIAGAMPLNFKVEK